jgi:hypothetical protein
MCSLGLHKPTNSSAEFVVWSSFAIKEVGLDVHSMCKYVVTFEKPTKIARRPRELLYVTYGTREERLVKRSQIISLCIKSIHMSL